MAYRSLMRSRFYRVVAVTLAIALIASPLPLRAGSHLFGPVVAQAQASPPPPLAALPGDAGAALQQLLKAPLPGGLAALDGLDSSALVGQSATGLSLGTQLEESAATNPLSISRIQSAYRPADAISGTLVITFTVTNNLAPASAPSIPASATVTDTLDVLAAVDLSTDPNAIRGVLVTDWLADGAAFVSSSPLPDRAASPSSELAWGLGNIPPLGSATATLTLQVPAAATAFIYLDSGAAASGSLQGRAVSAKARPASLAPDMIDGQPAGDWLKWTEDADTRDPDMLARAADFGQEPLRMFEYVRSLGYECYKGSLRGTRGTLWSAAGNSLDKASLLIAMLRASGIPARYRHGTLSTDWAQALILSMFPPVTRVVGHRLQDAAKSDPAYDPKLLAEAQDHWWVEAYLPGTGWWDLDPSFETAQSGQRLLPDSSVATDGTDRVAEVPATLRHKVSIQLKVEKSDSIASLAGGLSVTYPLSLTASTAALFGQPVTLRHLVDGAGSSGPIFYAGQCTYTPLLFIGAQAFRGQSFGDLISNFPLASSVVTGIWLVFDVSDADGHSTRLSREIADRIGFESRQAGGSVAVSVGSSTGPIVHDIDAHSIVFAPGLTSPRAVAAQGLSALAGARDLRQALDLAAPLAEDSAQPATLQWASREQRRILWEQAVQQDRLSLLYYCLLSDFMTQATASTTLVRAYHDTPRVIMMSTTASEQGAASVLDLRSDPIRAVAYPGQPRFSEVGFRATRGIADAVVESSVVEQATGSPVVSVAEVFKQVIEQRIPAVTIDSSHLAELSRLDISQEAKARITRAAGEGWRVVVPERMVTCNGVTTIGWWQIGPISGDTIAVGEDGNHFALENATVQAQDAVDHIEGDVIAQAEAIAYQRMTQYLIQDILTTVFAFAYVAVAMVDTFTHILEYPWTHVLDFMWEHMAEEWRLTKSILNGMMVWQ